MPTPEQRLPRKPFIKRSFPLKNTSSVEPSRVNYNRAQRIKLSPKDGQRLDPTQDNQDAVHASVVDGKTFVDASRALIDPEAQIIKGKKRAEAEQIRKVFGEEAARRYLALD